MRLICPHCQVSVTLPDQPASGHPVAGTPTPCPQCGQPITPPALTGAAIDAAPVPAPPPPPSHVVSTPLPPITPVAAPTRMSGPGGPWMRLTLRRDVAHWITPALLIIAFLLTFCTWVAVAPNGTRIYTQNAWQAAGGGFSTDLAGDNVMKAESDLRAHMGASVWLIFYLIVLIPTVVIAIADRVLARNPATIPDVLRVVWPHRHGLVAGLCALLVVLLAFPVLFGFGLQSAALAAAEAAVPAAQAAPNKPAPTTGEQTERDLRRDIQVAHFGIQRTAWLKWTLAALIFALFGAGLAIWLDRHPAAPDPRLEIYC